MTNRFDAYYLPTIPVDFISRFGLTHDTGGLLDLHEQGITDDDIPQLIEYLNNHPEITTVNLLQNSISHNARLFMQANHIVTLLLYMNQIHVEEAVILMQHPTIRVLGIGMNALQGLTAAIIAKAKETNKDMTDEESLVWFVSNLKLSFLDLSYFLGVHDAEDENISQREIPLITALGTNGNKLLTHLRVIKCPMNDNVARALASNRNFKSLGLSCTGIGDVRIQHFAENPNLTHLDLADASLSIDGLRVCLSMPNLTSLEIHENNLDDTAAHEIAAAASRETFSLTRLAITGCRLTEQGIMALLRVRKLRSLAIGNHDTLADAATINPVIWAADHLEELNINGIRIVNPEIVTAFASLENLKKLDIGNCNLDVNTINQIVEVINRRTTHLKELNVEGNDLLGDEGGRALARLMKVGYLIAEECGISDEGAIAIANSAHFFTGINLNRNPITPNGKRAFLNNSNLFDLQIQEEERRERSRALEDVAEGQQLELDQPEENPQHEVGNDDEEQHLELDHLEDDLEDEPQERDSEIDRQITQIGTRHQQREWIKKRVDEFQILLCIMTLRGKDSPFNSKIIKLVGFLLLKGLRSDGFIEQTLGLLVDNYHKPEWKKQVQGKDGKMINIFRSRPATSFMMFSVYEPLRVKDGVIKDEPREQGRLTSN